MQVGDTDGATIRGEQFVKALTGHRAAMVGHKQRRRLPLAQQRGPRKLHVILQSPLYAPLAQQHNPGF